MIQVVQEKRWKTVDIYFFGVRTKRRVYDKVTAQRYVEYVSRKAELAKAKIKQIEKDFTKEIRLYP
jgi:hypothetical protein